MYFYAILFALLVSIPLSITIDTNPPQPDTTDKKNDTLPTGDKKNDTVPVVDKEKVPKENSTQPEKNSTISNCTDLAADCAKHVNTLCKKTEYLVVMYKKCRNTCGMCNMTEEPCVDKNRNCLNWNRRGYCSNNFYSTEEKKENCAETCNLCAKTTDKCRDVNKNCANWDLKGFCASVDYKEAIKKANCAKTCKLC